MMSLNTPPSHKPLISATLMFCCPAEHSFHFRVGSMVPTMMDVVALTGLPCTGETAYAGMSVPDIEYHRPKSAGKPGFITTYGTFIDTCMKSDSSISEEEHISFLSCWLNRYLCCSPTLAMTADFVDPAKVLHSGRRVALAPLALSYLYRGMNEVFKKSLGTFPGPLWLLQLWLQAYFPDLRYDPPPSPVHDFSTYGSWLSSFPMKEVTFHGCFQFFFGLSSLPPSPFHL